MPPAEDEGMSARGLLPGQAPAPVPARRGLPAVLATATAIPAAGQLAVQMTAAFTLAVAARRLDATALATYVVATTVLGTAAALVDSGLTPLGVRESARDPDRGGEIFRTVLLLRLALSIPMAVVAGFSFVLLVPAGAYGGPLGGLVLALAVLLTGFAGSYRVPAQAQLRLGGLTAADVLGRLATQGALLLTVLTLAPRPHAALLSGPLALGGAVTLGVCAVACRSLAPLRPWHVLSGAARRAILRSAWPLGLAMIVNQLYFRMDMLIVSATRPEVDVGAYGLAYRVLEAANVFGGLFQAAVFPVLSAASGDPARWHSLARRSVLVMALAGLVLALGGLVFSGLVIRVLGGGNYPEAAPVLSVLLVAGGLAWVNGLLGLLIITLERQREVLWVNVSALAVNAALCVALVPAHGILAAAWVGVGTELLMLAGNLALLRRWAPQVVATDG